MAVAGFTDDEIKIEVKEQSLTVRGDKAPEDKERHFLHRGIAARSFERRFQLADYVEVKAADLKDGLLHIDLQRNIPERMRPRTIRSDTLKRSARSKLASRTCSAPPAKSRVDSKAECSAGRPLSSSAERRWINDPSTARASPPSPDGDA